jgi:hypothetical protein
MTIVDPSITEVASQAVSAILPVLPPSKAVPSSFGTSVKHWWATGDKEAAIAEERLLRLVSATLAFISLLMNHAQTSTLLPPFHSPSSHSRRISCNSDLVPCDP